MAVAERSRRHPGPAASFERAVLAALDRRMLLRGAAAAGLAALAPRRIAALAASLPAPAELPDRLKGSGVVRLASAGGLLSAAQRTALFEPFQALSGIRIVETEGVSAAQVKSQVDSKAVQWDLMGLEYSNIADLERQGEYFEPLDYDLISTDGFPANQVHDRSLGYLMVGVVLTYRTDAFGGKVPKSYKDFWDLDKFPGPRNWMSPSMGICPFIEGALLADGVPRDKLYPLDVPRALASLTRIRQSIVKFWESGAQSAQLMADNETVMGVAWNGRIGPLVAAGEPVAVQWNEEMIQTDNWGVLKGAANRANAMKFIAYAALPQSQARLSQLIDYGFTNTHAAAFLSPERLEMLPSAHLDQGFVFDVEWWGQHKRQVIEAVTQWSLG